MKRRLFSGSFMHLCFPQVWWAKCSAHSGPYLSNEGAFRGCFFIGCDDSKTYLKQMILQERNCISFILSNKILEVKRECLRLCETMGSQYSLLFETRFKKHASGIVIGNLLTQQYYLINCLWSRLQDRNLHKLIRKCFWEIYLWRSEGARVGQEETFPLCMQSQQRPQMIPLGALELEWPYESFHIRQRGQAFKLHVEESLEMSWSCDLG